MVLSSTMPLNYELRHTHRWLLAAGVLREPRLPEMLYADREAVATQLGGAGFAIRLRLGFRCRPEVVADKTAGLIRLRRAYGGVE